MIEICIKTSSGKKLREDFILLKLSGRGSSGMSHLQLERTLGRAFLPSAEWGCHRAQGQGREKNALIHFLTRYAWEGSPQGCCGGGLWLCFSSGSAPQQQRWAASNSHPEAWAAPQPGPSQHPRVLIGLVLQRKWLLVQAASKLRESGWVPARFELTQMFKVFGFCLTLFLKIFLLYYR